MTTFSLFPQSIDASKRRITAIWFADVSRIPLNNGSNLTGYAFMACVYTLASTYQFYVALFSLDNKLAEIWRATPQNCPISIAAKIESEILDALDRLNIHMKPISQDSTLFAKALSRLPLAFDQEEITANNNFFSPPGAKNEPSPILSGDEKLALRNLASYQ